MDATLCLSPCQRRFFAFLKAPAKSTTPIAAPSAPILTARTGVTRDQDAAPRLALRRGSFSSWRTMTPSALQPHNGTAHRPLHWVLAVLALTSSPVIRGITGHAILFLPYLSGL